MREPDARSYVCFRQSVVQILRLTLTDFGCEDNVQNMSPKAQTSKFSDGFRRWARLLATPTAIFLAALMIRAIALVVFNRLEDAATSRYLPWGLEALMISKSLAEGGGFAYTFPHYPYVTAWLAPVYPWLLSLGQIVLRLRGDRVVVSAQVLNVLFSALTVFPIYHVGKKVYGLPTGVGAAWLWALSPVAIIMPIEWLWDQSLAALLMALLLWMTYWIRESASPLHWSGYGLLWGAAALTNPSLCVVMPFLLLWLWFQRKRSTGVSGALLSRAVLFFVLAILPWTIRNYFEVGGLFFIKSNFGLELWLGNNPRIANQDLYAVAEQHPMGNYREYKLLLMTGEPVYSRLKQRDAIAFIRANPLTFRRLCYYRFVDTWTGLLDSEQDHYILPLGIRIAYVRGVALFSLVAFAGIFLGFFRNTRESIPLVLCVVIFPIPYYVTHSSLRYRHPIEPVIVIFAALAVTSVERLLRLKKLAGPETSLIPRQTDERESVAV
jgi:4-amino-4-deoxy-L-arabinose transferase-like glycosyltransferase